MVKTSNDLHIKYKKVISKVDANVLLKSQYVDKLIDVYCKYMLDFHKFNLNSHQQVIEDDLEILLTSHVYYKALTSTRIGIFLI